MKPKIAVITGGSSGIGKATAEKFLKEGYIVVIVGTDEVKLLNVKQELEGKYPAMVAAKSANVTNAGEVKELAGFVEKEYGAINALVNSAGVFRGGLLHESPDEDFDLQFDVNVKGVYNMMKYFIPMMLGGDNSIVNVASIAGMGGDYNAPLYCASKSAVIGMSRAAAMDYAGRGIRINVVSPSATETPMFMGGSSQYVIDLFKNAAADNKLGSPEQVAEAIYFLSSDSATHIVGQNLAVDGGISAWNGQPRQDKGKI